MIRVLRTYWPELLGLVLGCLIVALTSCAHSCPKQLPPPPVTVVAEPLYCNLPTLPVPLTDPIGYPAPDGVGIYVLVSDWAKLARYLMGLQGWIESATPCLTSQP